MSYGLRFPSGNTYKISDPEPYDSSVHAGKFDKWVSSLTVGEIVTPNILRCRSMKAEVHRLNGTCADISICSNCPASGLDCKNIDSARLVRLDKKVRIV